MSELELVESTGQPFGLTNGHIDLWRPHKDTGTIMTCPLHPTTLAECRSLRSSNVSRHSNRSRVARRRLRVWPVRCRPPRSTSAATRREGPLPNAMNQSITGRPRVKRLQHPSARPRCEQWPKKWLPQLPLRPHLRQRQRHRHRCPNPTSHRQSFRNVRPPHLQRFRRRRSERPKTVDTVAQGGDRHQCPRSRTRSR